MTAIDPPASLLAPDVEAAIGARVTAQIAAARRRREERDAWQAAHLERRRHGKARAHAEKLERLAREARDRQAGGSVRRAGRRGAS